MLAPPGAEALAEVLGRAVEDAEDLDQRGEGGLLPSVLVAAEHRPRDACPTRHNLHGEVPLKPEAPEGLAHSAGDTLVTCHGARPPTHRLAAI